MTTGVTRFDRAVSRPRVLKLGDSGDDVRELQNALVHLGLMAPKHITAKFDEVTESVVMAFQRDRGIGIDGRVGNQTRGELSKALAEKG